MHLHVMAQGRESCALTLALPDEWVSDVQEKLRGTRFEGLVSRLDPYADTGYVGGELSLFRDAIALYATRSTRFADTNRGVQRLLLSAQQRQQAALFIGD
jgi:hypothetical protein